MKKYDYLDLLCKSKVLTSTSITESIFQKITDDERFTKNGKYYRTNSSELTDTQITNALLAKISINITFFKIVFIAYIILSLLFFISVIF